MRTGSWGEGWHSRSLGELMTRTSEVLCLAYGLTINARFAIGFASDGSLVNQEGGIRMPAAARSDVASLLFWVVRLLRLGLRIFALAGSSAPPTLEPRAVCV